MTQGATALDTPKQSLTVIIPVFNEIEIVEQLHQRVLAACCQTGTEFTIVYVDDGSTDGTPEWLSANAIPEPTIQTRAATLRISQAHTTRSVTKRENDSPQQTVTLLQLSRNFGQPAAILAGLHHFESDCVVVMDGDLQDPPELIPQMVELWRAGDEVVIAKRTARQETFFRALAFKTFHRFFRYLSDAAIPANTGTFCLLDRKAAAAIRDLPEASRFFPGQRAWAGYQQTMLEFKRCPRAGGEPKQTWGRLIRYAADAVFGYSFKPLRLLTAAGAVICCVSMLLVCWFIGKRLMGWEAASIGFTTLSCAVLGLGGFQLIGMGILGEYIGRIYDEVKSRPQFLIARKLSSNYTQLAATARDEGAARGELGSIQAVPQEQHSPAAGSRAA